jgi:hypothetical protein
MKIKQQAKQWRRWPVQTHRPCLPCRRGPEEERESSDRQILQSAPPVRVRSKVGEGQTSEGYSAALVVVLYTGKYLVAPAQCSSAASVSAGRTA